ncbi:MAG: SDR family oxidoreductase [Polyangiaceae bacterium]|nr:SDR family oxidoreductase [Polyangiaceae bacterium]
MTEAPARLAGCCAVVTGAASGIGRATVLALAGNGARVVANDQDAEGLAETAELAAGARAAVRVVAGDAADEALVRELVATSVAAHGGLGFAFANAGIVQSLASVLDLEAGDWDALLRVNLVGTFLLVKHAARHMVEHGGGSIACTASVAALRAGAGPAHYAASKAAIVSLVQSAASQLGGRGVRVNAICPGLIETGMTRPVFELARAKGTEARLGQLNPLRRAGRAEEVAEVALFLAGEASSYVNGQAIVVDGGLSASLPFVPGRLW